jgi:predicted ABC-type ATPase
LASAKKQRSHQRNPKVYVIAGPNGAGKTTFAERFLPAYAECRNFVNADLIAKGVSPFAPEAAAFRAGRLMLWEIEGYAVQQADFGIETTLSGKTYFRVLSDLKRRGYNIHLFFLWLPNLNFALKRIRGRVLQGGHDIPATIVRRRFGRSLTNFFSVYRFLSDSWMLFDNSGVKPSLIASDNWGEKLIINPELYRDLVFRYERSEA